MICIYQKGNTDYTKNGDAVLNPTSAMLSMTINGAWQLTIEHPYDAEGKFEYLVEDAVVRVDVLCINELETVQQRFRIYNYVRNLHSVTAIAFPIAMESTYDAPVDNIILQNATGQQAMAALQQKTNKYTLSTDITAVASTSWANTNVNSAIAGSSDNTFLKVWGGEILYDNLKYKVRTRLGSNVAADHKVTYGNNLESIEYKKDDSGLITRIYPISKDGIRLNGTGYVDSPHISDYAVPHARYMEAPYSLISTSADDPSSTAQLTRQAISAVNSAASSLSQSVYATAKGNGYQPEYIKTIRSEIVSAVQTMALQNVISTSLYNAMASTIASAMDWMKDLKQPKWGWMGSDQSGWKYGDATSYAKNMYVKIGKTWSYFGNDGNWQEPRDSSDEWDWHDAKNGNGKQYGNFKKYFAHNEYVYITQSGTIKEYWFNEQGWFEEDESGDSDYYWHGSGTGADPYWFGASSSDYLKSCWRFIDGTYYFFDSYGYVAAQKDNYRWDWVENGDSSRAWFGNAEDSEYAADYLISQWEKINGTWYYFDANGIVESESVSQTKAVALFTTGMASLTSTVDNWKDQLYTLLYNLMQSYCAYQYRQGVDIPSITISVNMVELSQTTEYEGYEHLETIKLGDSVQCDDYQHSISTINRVVGITYDCIYKKIATVVLGEATATVQQMVGNANGQAVAGGFDTSALETQLAALRNGKQDKLTAGDNITIENNVISAVGGSGSNIYYGTDEPSASLGSDKDYYCQLSDDPQTIIGTPVAYGSMDTPSITAQSFNEFSAMISGIPTAYLYPREDEVEIPLENLVEGNIYTFSFNYQFDSGTRFFNTHNDGLSINGEHILFEEDTQVHSYSITFTAQETNILIFGYHTVYDNVRFSSHLTNGKITGVFKSIINVWVKVGNLWVKDAFGSALRAGANIQISNGVISATDTTYSDFIGATSQADGSSGLVPAPDAGEQGKYLKGDGSWDDPEGTTVIANPSGTGTTTLTKLQVENTIYNIPSGGGGGSVEDVYVNGQSVVDANDIAQVKTHKQVLSSEYQDQNDDIIYFVEDDEELGVYYAPVIYSTEEREIGVWKNGKPLYQKTIVLSSELTISNRDWTSVGITASSLDIETYVECTAQNSSGTCWDAINVATISGNISLTAWRNGDTIGVKEFTIQYTKTTDTPTDAQYNALGVPMVHYTTDEQVIGMWVDGKPLYKKTFTGLSQATNGVDWVTVQGVDLPSVKDIINATAWATGGTGEQIRITLAEISVVNNNGIRVSVISSAWNRTINKMTVQYTKTTD